MKKIISLIAIAFCFSNVFSQDLIVTNNEDSLNCSITKLDTATIHFDFLNTDNDEVISTFLPYSDVKIYKIAYFQTSEIADQATDMLIDNSLEPINYPRFRFSFSGGYSYRTAAAPTDLGSEIKSYYEGLKKGNHYGGDITVFFKRNYGIGFKYLVSNSSNKLDGQIFLEYPDGSKVYGPLSDDITIKYIGSYFSCRLLSKNNKNSFFYNLGFGYMGYQSYSKLVYAFDIVGATLGTCVDIGYDIGLAENMALGFQLSYLSGSITKFTMSDGTNTETITLDEEDAEGLNRFDFSVGLRIVF